MAVWLVVDSVPRCVPHPSSNLASIGRWRHATDRENYRGEPGSTLSGGCRPDSARGSEAQSSASQGPKAQTGRFLMEKLISDHDLFSSCQGQQEVVNGQGSWGFYRDAHGFRRLNAGSRAGSTNSEPPSPWTSVFRFSLFLCDM